MVCIVGTTADGIDRPDGWALYKLLGIVDEGTNVLLGIPDDFEFFVLSMVPEEVLGLVEEVFFITATVDIPFFEMIFLELSF